MSSEVPRALSRGELGELTLLQSGSKGWRSDCGDRGRQKFEIASYEGHAMDA